MKNQCNVLEPIDFLQKFKDMNFVVELAGINMSTGKHLTADLGDDEEMLVRHNLKHKSKIFEDVDQEVM